MEHVEELRKDYPELVEEYSSMTKEELLNQICAEVLDLQKMNDRVQLFMNECTIDMSKTTYTLDTIKTLIIEKQEYDIATFCSDYEGMNDEDILTDLAERASRV